MLLRHLLSAFCYISEIRLVAIGKTGEGKSSTCNSILGEKYFKPSIGPLSETKETKYKKNDVHGLKVAVVDTPGFF